MKVIIDIPKEEYELIRHGNKSYITELTLLNAVVDGTPLPEHHGRLIDADALPLNAIDDANHGSNYIRIAPTIIEADKEVDE